MTTPTAVRDRAAGADPGGGAAAGHGRGGRRRRLRLRVVALLLALLMLAPATSYVRALTYPGSATWQERSVEWLRDSGAGSVVNAVENWVYTRRAPSSGAPDAATVPGWSAAAAAGTADAAAPAPLLPLAGAAPLRGEGQWVAGRADASGRPVIYTTVVRPDPAHPSVVAGAAWVRAGSTAAHLVAGTRQPDGRSWPGQARISPGDIGSLVATFNSGWKYKDLTGGFYLAGRTAGALRDGAASVVIDRSGGVRVGRWGQDVQMTPDVVAVRQNLDLVVENGSAVAGLDRNAGGRWGSARNQLQYTWRSGIGTDTAGDLVYVAGPNLTLRTLAAAMVDAGIVRGMELDIHPGMTSFSSWTVGGGGTVTPTKLLPGMSKPADRYVVADQRDFFYLTMR